ncbi:MAG: putative glycosyltransferase EpsJ [Syntrophomonadaceae bacterium]|nr:putative glycosyltransferase EpsJ [Bacillota bacterium]
METLPNISVVIPTFNRCEDLKRCLDSLLNQTVKEFEIIIVDNGCTDGTVQLVASYPVRIVRDTSRNVTHLFNVGWKVAKADIVAFINDDAEAGDVFWLSNILDTFERFENAGAVGGPTVLPDYLVSRQEMLRLHKRSMGSVFLRVPAYIYEKIILDGKYSEVGVLCESGAYSVGGSLPESMNLSEPIVVDLLSITNVAVRKRVLQDLGGLDEHFRFTHGDGDLFVRIREAGYKLIFNPRVFVWHYVNPFGDTRGAYWRGRDHAYFMMKSVKPKTLSGRFKYFLNILFFNGYWLYKAVETRNLGFTKGLFGFWVELFTYWRNSIRK